MKVQIVKTNFCGWVKCPGKARMKILLKIILFKRKYYKEFIAKRLTEELPYQPRKEQIKWCYWDFLRYSLRYMVYDEERYFRYNVYRKSELSRNESFVCGKIARDWRANLLNPELVSLYNDKKLFCKDFQEFMARDFLCVEADTTFQTFYDFMDRHQNDVFAKEPTGIGGKQVQHWRVHTDAEMRSCFAEAVSKKMLLEERVVQCKELAEFSPTSLNTVRIVTIIDEHNNIQIANACFRMGGGGEW